MVNMTQKQKQFRFGDDKHDTKVRLGYRKLKVWLKDQP